MSSPYKKYENTDLWKLIDKSIRDLVGNNDIELLTKNEYIVGYLCKQILSSDKIKTDNLCSEKDYKMNN